jgi:hypothetical protein
MHFSINGIFEFKFKKYPSAQKILCYPPEDFFTANIRPPITTAAPVCGKNGIMHG